MSCVSVLCPECADAHETMHILAGHEMWVDWVVRNTQLLSR